MISPMTDLVRAEKLQIPPSDIPALLRRYQMMPQLLREIVIDRAIAKYECTPEEKEDTWKKTCELHKLGSDEEIEAWLKKQGMTREEAEATIVRPLLVGKYKQEKWGHRVESYFLTRKQSLDRVVYSLLRTKDKGLAQEIFYRIEEGEQEFTELARDYSEGPEARTGGLLGPVPLTQPHPLLSKMLSVSQPGQLWSPRQLADWFIIVRLEKYYPAQLDDAMRNQLIDEMFETWLKEELASLENPGEVFQGS